MSNKWISVKDRLPSGGCYLVRTKGGGIDIFSFCRDGSKIDGYELRGQMDIFYDYDSEYGYYPRNDVTHWMLLPAPPEEEEGDDNDYRKDASKCTKN